MINLREKDTNRSLGTITEVQLQFPIDQLEEEGTEDQDYAISNLLLDSFTAEGADPELVSLLRNALGEQEEIEIVWSR